MMLVGSHKSAWLEPQHTCARGCVCPLTNPPVVGFATLKVLLVALLIAAANAWFFRKFTKTFGYVMIGIYVLFVIVSISLEIARH
jgi:hypothetical protein